MRLSINVLFVVVMVFGAAALVVPQAASAAEGKGKVLVDEMTVTARKREESLQDTPVAVSAFSGAQLEFRGVTNIGQIDQFTPNLVLNDAPSNSNVISAAVYIRGIGQNDFVPVIDPGVGIYVDGVYLGRSIGGVLDIVDVDRIEVLRGPQGTLFGRNTIGGAVDIKTRKPDEDFGGQVSLRGGTDAMMHLRGAVNVPITDTFYTRFSGAVFQQDGYVTRPFDGQDLGNDDTYVLRAAGRWVPNDDLEFNLSFDYSKDDQDGSPFVITGIQPLNLDLASNPNGGPSMVVAQNTIVAQLENGGIMPDGEFFNPVNPPTGFPFNTNACFEPQNQTNASCYNTRFIDDGSKNTNLGTDPNFQELETWGVNLNFDWALTDNLDLKSITSFRTFDGHFEGDEDGGPQRISYLIDLYDHDQFSQELQLLGTSFDDRLQWITGLYYYNEEGENLNPVRFSQVWIQSGGQYEATSWALFAQGTWSFTESLDLTVGLRYTDDERKYRPDQFFEAFPMGGIPPGPPPNGFNCPAEPGNPFCDIGSRVLPFEWVTTSNDELLPHLNLSYRFTDGLMGYATYSKGYKSGGFTQRIFPPEPSLPSFNPEYVDSYEVGLKWDGWDDKLRVNFAGFFNDYTDLQLLVADPTRVGPFVTNAGDAEIKGFELEAWFVPAEGWYLMGTLGYTDPEYTSLSGGVQGITLDSRFEHISDWTASAQLYKEISLASLGYLTPRIEWSYRSEYGTNLNNVPRDGADTVVGGPFDGVNLGFGVPNPPLLQDDLHLLNVGIRWDITDSGFALTGAIDNLTDEEYRVWGNYQDAFGFTQEGFDRGRQWWVQLEYEF
jgi:iron complex outermembrane receptor protein